MRQTIAGKQTRKSGLLLNRVQPQKKKADSNTEQDVSCLRENRGS
jgi:hypothetical protein